MHLANSVISPNRTLPASDASLRPAPVEPGRNARIKPGGKKQTSGDVQRPPPEPPGNTAAADELPNAAMPTESPANDLINQQLAEKDALIGALTDRLEQAAEQLDRMRRNGADRGWRGGGGLPPELIDEHKSTVDELKQVIARWEGLEAAATWGRIEGQISELRDLVASQLSVAPAAPAARPASSDTPRPAEKTSSANWWEAQKAALLGEAPPEPTPKDHESDAATPHTVEIATTEPSGATFDVQTATLPELPPPVDFETLTLDEARRAIADRDAALTQLREPLLLAMAAAIVPRDLTNTRDLPPALLLRLDELESQWQAKFRQCELDLSRERARLAREAAALSTEQEAARKELARRGLKTGKSGDATTTDPAAETNRRWFKFLGHRGADEVPHDAGGDTLGPH